MRTPSAPLDAPLSSHPSPGDAQVLDVTRQQEVTKQTEHKEKEADYRRQVAQLEKEREQVGAPETTRDGAQQIHPAGGQLQGRLTHRPSPCSAGCGSGLFPPPTSSDA